MKNQSVNTLKLGIFVFAGLALLIAGIYFIGNKQNLFSNTFRISGIFNNVNGLQVGNNVRFSGINVGTVDAIEIVNDTSVRVDMLIDESTRRFIKKDARAVIGSEGLMGNMILNITPGTSNMPPIKNNDMIATSQPVSFNEVMDKLRVTGDNAVQITSDFAAIIGTIRSGKGVIGKLFMDTTMGEDLDKTLLNIRQGSKGFKQNMDAAKNSILLRGSFRKKKEDKEKTKEEGKKEGE